MFKYKNDKGAMRIVDTSNDKEYRLSMPHEVVQLVELLNAAQLLRAPVNQDTTEALVHDIYTWVCMNTSISKEEGKNFGRFLRERLGRR